MKEARLMASSTSNLMDSIENPNGRVSVKLQRNHFSKDSSDKYVERAVRNTHTVENVLQLVANKVPQLDIGTVYSVCDALEKAITESLGGGNSVNCLNLGVFYLACKGSADGVLSLNGSVQITGKKLLVGGEDSGIWLAPAAENSGAIDESIPDFPHRFSLFCTHPIFPPKTENFSKVARRNPDNISTASYRRADIQTPVIYVSFKNGKFH